MRGTFSFFLTSYQAEEVDCTKGGNSPVFHLFSDHDKDMDYQFGGGSAMVAIWTVWRTWHESMMHRCLQSDLSVHLAFIPSLIVPR